MPKARCPGVGSGQGKQSINLQVPSAPLEGTAIGIGRLYIAQVMLRTRCNLPLSRWVYCG
eukprot:2179081-Amphidinium_carterae.1